MTFCSGKGGGPASIRINSTQTRRKHRIQSEQCIIPHTTKSRLFAYVLKTVRLTLRTALTSDLVVFGEKKT